MLDYKMDRQKLFKKEMSKLIIENKMSDKNIMQFKDFKGQSNFAAFVDPFKKTTKKELESMIKDCKYNNKSQLATIHRAGRLSFRKFFGFSNDIKYDALYAGKINKIYRN